jgi:hypothetical protein
MERNEKYGEDSAEIKLMTIVLQAAKEEKWWALSRRHATNTGSGINHCNVSCDLPAIST